MGPLFKGKFKAVLIEKETHLLNLPHYIHLNPLKILTSPNIQNKVKDASHTIEILKTYRWSSLLDYLGVNNFPKIVKKDFFLESAGGLENFLANMRSGLENKLFFDSLNQLKL